MNPHYFLGFIIVILSYWIGKLYEPFLANFIIATILATATAKLHFAILKKVKILFIASTLSTLLLSLLFFMPIIYLISRITILLNMFDKNKLIDYIEETKEIGNRLANDFLFMQNYIHSFIDSLDVTKITTQFVEFTAYFGKNSFSFIVDIIMILIFYFFIMFYSKNLILFIKDSFPLNITETNRIFLEISNVMSVVFYSILVTAIFEGLLFGFFVSYFGYDAILFGILYALASLIPVVGGIIMWLPLGLYEMAMGEFINAILIIIYSIVVISIIADTFIKPMIISYINKVLIKGGSTLNELIIFFSIVAGLSTFGFWGMIIGPALTSLFFSIIKIFQDRNREKITKK